MESLFYKSTGRIVAYVTNVETGNYIDDATATITIKTASDNTPLSGSSWPVTMTNSGSGYYYYTVDKDLLSTGSFYIADVNIQKNSSYRRSTTKFKLLSDTD